MARDAVLVTGISGNLGRALARVLHKTDRVIGLDRRPFPGAPKDLEVHNLDIRKRKVEDLFRRGDVLSMIHMAIAHDPRLPQGEHHSFNVLGTKAMLSYAAKHGVRKVVVLSSATVYGPQPGNDNFLTEESPLLGSQRFPEFRDLVEVDMFAQQYMWKHPEVDTVILRPVHIVGPTVKNAPSMYMRLPRPWTLAALCPRSRSTTRTSCGRHPSSRARCHACRASEKKSPFSNTLTTLPALRTRHSARNTHAAGSVGAQTVALRATAMALPRSPPSSHSLATS